MSKQRGSWINLKENRGGSTSQHWPPTAAVSTCAVVVSAEQSGHFHSVRGTDKIVLSEPAKATTSLQTAPVRAEHGQASDPLNKLRVPSPDKR
jgi:hypothetical protein